MKLWIAAFFATEESRRADERAFLVRARDVSECAFAAEEHILFHPGLVSPEYEIAVSAVIDLQQEAARSGRKVL